MISKITRTIIQSLLILITTAGFAQTYEWAKSLGSTESDQGMNIAVDGSGNVYCTGTFQLTADFDPGSGTTNLTSWGSMDIYVTKFDVNGNYVWATRIGGTGVESARSIAVDGSGNVYISGYFSGTVDFDPGLAVSNLISSGSSDAFYAKYDASGNYVWAYSLGGSGYDYGNSIAVDMSGNVYVGGLFRNTVDFDPGGNTANLSSSGNTDIFFAKYDSNGDYIWAKAIGGTSTDACRSIVVDDNGNVYIAGIFNLVADFDPGVGVANLIAAGVVDIFLAAYDTNGDYMWAKSIGSTDSDGAADIVVDASGNVYISGWFSLMADFDYGMGTANLVSVGSEDIFIAKYDATGNYIWANRIGGSNSDKSSGIEVDNSGNVYITGYFENVADFDPGVGTANLTSLGGWDIFLAKYDGNGNYVWACSIGSTDNNEGRGVATDNNDNVYVAGYFGFTADFDPDNTGVANLTSAGKGDIFFAKYSSGPTSIKESQLSLSQLSVYPNPNTGLFNVAYESAEIGILMLSITNYLGQQVYTQSFSGFNGTFNKELNLSAEPAGIYNIQLTTDKQVIVKRVVVE